MLDSGMPSAGCEAQGAEVAEGVAEMAVYGVRDAEVSAAIDEDIMSKSEDSRIYLSATFSAQAYDELWMRWDKLCIAIMEHNLQVQNDCDAQPVIHGKTCRETHPRGCPTCPRQYLIDIKES